jgi:DNA polymerase
MNKQSLYRVLVEKRKSCGLCLPQLQNPATIDGGRLDSDEIGPYSRWQGNLNSELMVIAQDFADARRFRKVGGWPDGKAATNRFLRELIAEAGITIAPPKRGKSDDRVFFTNAVLCMKDCDSIPDSCFKECGTRFVRPLIELVSPKVVVTLGMNAMRAVCGAFRIDPPLKPACGLSEPIWLTRETRLMPVYHPSPRVRNSGMRSDEAQRADWQSLRQALPARFDCSGGSA